MGRDLLYASIICGIIYAVISFSSYRTQTNITDKNELWGGYNVDNEYMIQTEVLLKYYKKGGYLILSPKSCKENCQSEQHLGTLKKGTKLHLSRLEHIESFNLFFGHVELVTPFAKIATGEFAGKEVELECISIKYQKSGSETVIYKPDNDLIAAIEQNGNT